jgi:hypothetical protein
MSSIKLMGIEITDDGATAWRNNGGCVERRFLYNESRTWQSVADTTDCPRDASGLEAFCDAENATYAPRATARIFEDATGMYYICSEDDDCLDARGRGYQTKTEALRAAAASYTHAIGSGCPWDGVRSLDRYL